jgi:hypothetical protein
MPYIERLPNTLPTPLARQLTIRASNLRPQGKGTLRAFVDLELFRIGCVLRDCTWIRNPDGREWVGLPSKSYQGSAGVTRWRPVAEFSPDAYEARQRFQERRWRRSIAPRRSTR